MAQTLVLDQGYQPHHIITWQRAVTMLFAGKVEVVEEYDEDIRSVSITIKMPAVVRLLRRVHWCKRPVKFSRINVMSRDKFRCQYCGQKLPMRRLSYDHIVPRCQGGRTTWENIVTACFPCNDKKGNKTPEQAGMKLLSTPRRPTFLPFLAFSISTNSIPDAWASWVYWQGSLVDES